MMFGHPAERTAVCRVSGADPAKLPRSAFIIPDPANLPQADFWPGRCSVTPGFPVIYL